MEYFIWTFALLSVILIFIWIKKLKDVEYNDFEDKIQELKQQYFNWDKKAFDELYKHYIIACDRLHYKPVWREAFKNRIKNWPLLDAFTKENKFKS